ncbi:MAG: hypothetical protein KBD06_04305 [Candidatus Pacebacteria bacterium]|nr:hypothetical protein [Candidatus Paceibacterota bacterium]
MGEVVELSRFRPRHPDDDAVDRSVTEELVEQAVFDPWMSDFKARMNEDEAREDMLYVCLNRPLIERMLELVEEIEGVLPKCTAQPTTDGLFVVGSRETSRIRLSGLVEELRHSTHVLWLSQPEHYAALVAEYRRRIDRYNKVCGMIDWSH